MDGPGRSSGFRQSRRSRSQRDRERRRRRGDLTERRPSSPSSCSEREAGGRDGLGGGCRVGRGSGAVGKRHRPPRRRKRESVSCEEDIIDGFAIASFISLEALEVDCSLKPPERAAVLLRRGGKRKRCLEENGGGSLSEPEAGDPSSCSPSAQDRARKRRRKRETSRNVFLETGYICDSESESGDKASDYEMEPMFTVSARKVLESGPVSMGSSVTKSHPPSSSICGLPRLSVTPRVSGLQRSQERSLEPLHPDSLSSSFSSSTSTSSCIPTYSLTTYVSCTSATTTVPGQRNGDGHFQRCAPSPPQPKPKPFLSYPGPPLSHYTIGLSSRNSTSAKPPPSSSASSSSLRPPTPSMNITLSLGCGPGFPGSMRPPSHPSSGAIFSPSSGLPPPPPLLQVPSHPTTGMATSTAAVLTELNSRFLTSQTVEREGGGSASGNQVSGGAAPAASGGPSASSSGPGASGCASQAQPTIPPLAFQFHQHNHQHQHTHTHQHFAPFLPPSAAASPLFDKYPGKMESLYRHPFFPQYPTSMSGMPPVLPPAGPFSSLQGAFQPKGTSPEMAARLGPVPHRLQSKDPRKPGKWCAMHVRVAWMILRHQEKVKLLQVDPHKLDFRNNLLSRLPGAGGFGGLRGIGAQGSGLPSAHELARPASLFTASGGVHPSASTFAPPSTPHSSFITPSAHLDPFGRSPPFSSLGSLGTGAFGGLGSPSLGTNSVFGHKESQGGAVGSLANPHDPWNRLHHTPPSFPTTPTWVKGMDKREERVKEAEKKEVVHIKDEKDRDNSYGRHPVRMSPAAPSLKLCSSTPVSHSSSLGWAVGSSGGPSEDEPPRARSRERDRDTKLHSIVAPKAPLPVSSSSAPERPCSSSSSAPPTPLPPACLVPSPLNLYARQPPSSSPNKVSRPTQREGGCSTPPSASVSLHPVRQYKPDQGTQLVVPKLGFIHPPKPLLPPIKVKEERKDEVEPVPISVAPSSMSSHSYDQPSSRQHPAPSSAHLSLGPPPSIPQPPSTPHSHHHPLSLSLLDRSRAAAIEAYLGVAGSSGGIVVGAAGDRFPTHPHAALQGHSQSPHGFPWDPWRELAAQQQQREALTMRPDSHLALRTDPHLARLLQHQQVQRFFEAERAVAAVVGPHHPPASSSSTRQEFGLLSHHHHQERPPQASGPIGSLLEEDQRAHILREDFERVRYYGMHPHAHLSNPLLSGASHAAHLDQLHPGLLSHAHSHQPGSSPRHPNLYSRLGPLHPHSHHVPNGLLTKTASGLVGPLSVGAPPPLIPSVTPSRASTSPRNSRVGGGPELVLYSAPKDRESR
ncbi:autism susceptibility gene 2 protein homolog isoform X2 [Anguilla rostrata]|uniref:autism susceptibility gene 2 protein homolog isoform X2 n=1 Tax=Anguilla rostrata TaxID=7938 RepID=UPI0030CEE179